MKALFYTREFPPYVYGGAGVHVEYLAAELAKLMKVDVRCFGDQDESAPNLNVKGFPYDNPTFKDADGKLKAVFQTLSTCLEMNSEPVDADVVHCHTWYAHFAGIVAKLWHPFGYNHAFLRAFKTLETRTIGQRLRCLFMDRKNSY